MTGFIIITTGLVIDIFNSIAGIKRINKKGVSGIPLIPFILYIIGILLLEDITIEIKTGLIGLSFFVHIFFLWFFVYLVSKFIYKNK